MKNSTKFLKLYEKWQQETKFLSIGNLENKNYTEMQNLCVQYPNEIIPIIRDILLEGPNQIVGILNSLPAITITGYVPLIPICDFWLNLIKTVEPKYEILVMTKEELANNPLILEKLETKQYYEKYEEWMSYKCQYEAFGSLPGLQEFTNNRNNYKHVLNKSEIKNYFLNMQDKVIIMKKDSLFKYDENLSEAQNAEKYFEMNDECPNQIDMFYGSLLQYEKQKEENSI